jgi:hypothetical protein
MRTSPAFLLAASTTVLTACQTNPAPAAPGAQGAHEAEQAALARACAPGAGAVVSDELRRRVSQAGALGVLVRLNAAAGSVAAIAQSQKRLLTDLAARTSVQIAGDPASSQDSAGLFTPPPGVPALDLAAEIGVIRNRYVGVNFALLPASAGGGDHTIPLNLFDDAVFVGVVERVESAPSGPTLVGRLQGHENSSMTLVTYDGVMMGSVSAPNGEYQIRYAGNGVHAVRQFDASRLPRELPPLAPGGGAADTQAYAVIQTYTSVPLIGLRVTPRALDALAASPEVACVGELGR